MSRHEKRLNCVRFRGSQQRGGAFSAHMVLLATVICIVSVPSVVAQSPEYWYDPPCRNEDFTWTTRSGDTQECRYIDDIDAEDSGQGDKYCPNPLDPLPDGDESLRPPPAVNVLTSYYRTEFKYSDPDFAHWAGFWSAVNITFQLGVEAAGKVTGILFSMESLSRDSDDYSDMYCRTYNFVHPLSADALLDQDNNPKPGMEYEFTIRTLPVLDTSGADPNDTVVRFRYRAPSCYLVPDDYLCIKDNSEQPLAEIALCSQWKPQYFTVTADYRDLSVAVELGPEECGFDRFRLATHTPSNAASGVNLWASGVVEVDIANTSHFETFAYGRNITYIKVELKDVPIGQRVITVIPSPTQNTCFRNDGSPRLCSVLLSATMTVIENPCLSGPCSSLEVCRPHGEEFDCVCKPGFMRDDDLACVRNPCELVNASTQEPYNPCGSGSCLITNHKRSYSCECYHGFTFDDGTCNVDACVPNPCGNGTCLGHTSPMNESDYSCQCHSGYMNYNRTCTVDPCVPNPCGNGTCLHHTSPMNESDYSCQCHSGYMNYNRTCTVDPCVPNPCGNGTCLHHTSPMNESDYSCQCHSGYMNYNRTCTVDLCVPNPCGNGTCLHHTSPMNESDYSCQCHSGYLNHGPTCTADPCKTYSADGYGSPCGHHGTCRHSEQPQEIGNISSVAMRYICDCDLGYEYDDAEQFCQVSTGTIIAVIIMSFVIAAVLVLLLVAWRRRQNPHSILGKAAWCFGSGGSQGGIVEEISIPSQTPSVDGIAIPNAFNQDSERMEIIHPIKRVRTVLFYSVDHPLHEEAVRQLANFLNQQCMCDVILPAWCTRDITMRGVSEWITHVLDQADKVILLCSKGTRIRWHAHSNLPQPSVDIFTRAVSMILKDNASVGLPEKYCVAYFDYSSRNDIPAPLAVGAVYRLMKHMDTLFFRLHDMQQASPRSQRRTRDLEESNYATASPQGAALHSTIQRMHMFQLEEPDWYERFNNEQSRAKVEDTSETEAGDTSSLGPLITKEDEEFDSAMQEFLTMKSDV